MKKYFLPVFFVCGLVALTVSCAKDETKEGTIDTSTSVNSSSSLTAEVNGENFPVNLMNVSFNDYILQFIAGYSVNDRAIGLYFPYDITPGTYPTTETGSYRITYTSEANQNNFYSAKDNGTIVITSNNVTSKIIKGTFTANATHTSAGAANDTIKITEGKFTIVY